MKIWKAHLQKLTAEMENRKLFISQVIELIKGSNVKGEKVVDTANEIKLVVDYTKTLEQVIAEGNYNWENNNIIAKNFPVSAEMIGKKTEISAKLFHFNCIIGSVDVISEMDKVSYRPAALMELLILGILFPELQRQFPIVALGSVWHHQDGDCYVPFLYASGSRRELGLLWFDLVWDVRFRFLGVRK